jgi:hypothetical protein
MTISVSEETLMTAAIMTEETTEAIMIEGVAIAATEETLATVGTLVTVETLGIHEVILAMKDDATESIVTLEMGVTTETRENVIESENATAPCDQETIEIQTARDLLTDAMIRGKTLVRAIATSLLNKTTA